jgi:ribonuclease J
LADKVSIGRRFIDEGILEEVQEVVLRERRYLSEDGFVAAVLRLDRLTGELIGEPELASRGFVQSEELLSEAKNRILLATKETSLAEKKDEEVFNEIIRKNLRRLFRKRTGKRPLVLTFTIEI